MQSRTIMQAGPYWLVSYGNGTAYCLQNWGNEDCPEKPWEVFVQGDDAAQFMAEIGQIEAVHPTMPTSAVLGEVWATYWQGEA